jgi:hypothetical protein
VDAEALLEDVTNYCRRAGMAESTFGRLAVNDGKFVGRLRSGGRATADTVQRVRAFINARAPLSAPTAADPLPPVRAADPSQGPSGVFRFYENRQKYLLFVNTCSEKVECAKRIEQELPNLTPTPPAIRLFDAGVGDGTVLVRVLRTLHHLYEKTPFYVVGKEISVEDVRLALEKMADRFQEHPATCLVMTNMHYAEAPWLSPHDLAAASTMVWRELVLQGNSAAEFDRQIGELDSFLAETWTARISPATGNPVYQKPAVLVIYREDCRFLLDQVVPRRGAVRADGTIGTSTLFAAWNAATYNAQIEDHRLSEAMADDNYLKAAEDVLKTHGGLWFWDESFIISRKRDL